MSLVTFKNYFTSDLLIAGLLHGCRESEKPRNHKQLEQQTQHHQPASYLHVNEYCCKPFEKGKI